MSIFIPSDTACGGGGDLSGLFDDRGGYDASTNLFPATGGSGPAGAVLRGDVWTVTVAGTLGGTAVVAGDLVRALVDAPGQTAGNWSVAEHNLGYVPENSANKDTDGTLAANSDTKYASQKATKTYVDGKVIDSIADADTTHAPSRNAVFDGLALKVDKNNFPVSIAATLSDTVTALTVGNSKQSFRAPFAFTLDSVRASLLTASSGGTLVTVDINVNGASILSTKLTIDNGEKTSQTAAAAAVISSSAIADDDELTFDIDQAGSLAAGLRVWLIGHRTVT